MYVYGDSIVLYTFIVPMKELTAIIIVPQEVHIILRKEVIALPYTVVPEVRNTLKVFICYENTLGMDIFTYIVWNMYMYI